MDRRRDHYLPFGTRVRRKSDDKIGVIAWARDEKLKVVDGADFQDNVARKEFVVVCGNASCDKEGTKRCTRCFTAWYCSRKCQQVEWRGAHKQTCKPFDEVRRFKNVAILPPKNLSHESKVRTP